MSSLNGLRVVITRPRRQAGEFRRRLQELGAQPIMFPSIEISIPENHLALQRALKKLDCYEWMVLTSVNGVRAVWHVLNDIGVTSLPDSLNVAAIGPKTSQALRERGVSVDFVPEEYIAEAIMPGLGDLQGKWVLLPRADIARPDLANLIQESGGVAHEIDAYQTLPPQPQDDEVEALSDGVDVLTFTSSSTVRNFVNLLEPIDLDPLNLPGRPKVACIGPITAKTAREEGYAVDMVAEEYTIEGLLRALTTYFSKERMK